MSSLRILVAGATGYLGQFVVRELHQRGHFVRALVHSAKKAKDLGLPADEIVEADVTLPGTLTGRCDGMDAVFSSVGLTRQKTRHTFLDVDYQGNLNLLHEAQRAGVNRFVYVSVFNGPACRHLAIVAAHEDFVDRLRASGMAHTIVRPTGYFSDMGEFLAMARHGRVLLFGKGDKRMNPIHGADLAPVCADAVEGGPEEVNVGGPDVMTYREIAACALRAAGKRPTNIISVPMPLIRVAVRLLRVFSPHQADILDFLSNAMTIEGVAPATGTHTLAAHYAGKMVE